MESGEKLKVSATTSRKTCSELIGRFGLAYTRDERRYAMGSPFEPIASILEHCEEKTSEIMKPQRENA